MVEIEMKKKLRKKVEQFIIYKGTDYEKGRLWLNSELQKIESMSLFEVNLVM